METNMLNAYTTRILYGQDEIIPFEGNVDVEVVFASGKRYGATFFTLENINQIMVSYHKSGECNNGQYFWASDMIIVRQIDELTIQETIKNLLISQEFENVFAYYGET